MVQVMLNIEHCGCYFADVIMKVSSINIFAFWLKFHLNLLVSVHLAIIKISFDNGLAPNRWQAIISINLYKIYDAIWCQ